MALETCEIIQPDSSEAEGWPGELEAAGFKLEFWSWKAEDGKDRATYRDEWRREIEVLRRKGHRFAAEIPED